MLIQSSNPYLILALHYPRLRMISPSGSADTAAREPDDTQILIKSEREHEESTASDNGGNGLMVSPPNHDPMPLSEALMTDIVACKLHSEPAWLVCQCVASLTTPWAPPGEETTFRRAPLARAAEQADKFDSGHAAFLDPEVNKMLKKVLNEWGKYLQVSRTSRYMQ